MTKVITNPYAPTSSNDEISRLLHGINDLHRSIEETEARITRAKQRQGFAPVITEDLLTDIDRLQALKLDLAGSHWRLDHLLIEKLANYGIYTSADLQLFRR